MENLPEWSLSDLYENEEKIEEDIRLCEKEVASFCQKKDFWDDFLGALQAYEQLSERQGRLYSFAALSYYKNLNDPKVQAFYQRIREKIAEWSAKTLFFTLDITKKDTIPTEKNIEAYLPWINQLRVFKQHQCSEAIEKLFIEKAVTSSSAWVRLYDDLQAKKKFVIDGEEMFLPRVIDVMSSHEEEKRRKAAFALSYGLQEDISTYALIYNTLLKDRSIENEWRHFSSPAHERHLHNQVTQTLVENLTTSICHAYKETSHRYYQLKAKLLEKDQLEYWDRNAPLPQADKQKISWPEAKKIVLDAYAAFSPRFGALGQEFFDKGWIDVPVKEGKTSGAFAHPTVPSAHPYLLLNFQGKVRDVMTLAHELGHGIHQVLINERHTYLLTDTPLTIAETASVFGEMLTFRSLLEKTETKEARRHLLAGKIEDMLNTTVRQVAFHNFEQKAHDLRQTRELLPQDFGDIFFNTQKEALGPGVRLDETIRPYWAYISHFFHVPFYVYAYAFGDCLVNSLYANYEQNPSGFAKKYEALLAAGGTQTYKTLLAPFGLDIAQADFWQQGLKLITHLINDFEETL